MAWCLSLGDLIPILLLPGAQNCSTRQAGAGLLPAVSTSRDIFTRRRCCLTDRCSSQGELVIAVPPRARNCTIRQPEAGRPPVVLTPHATGTSRRCCPTA